MGKETGGPQVVSAYTHKVIKRCANEEDLEAARERIGRKIEERPDEEGQKGMQVLRFEIMDAYLDDIKRLILVLRPVGAW